MIILDLTRERIEELFCRVFRDGNQFVRQNHVGFPEIRLLTPIHLLRYKTYFFSCITTSVTHHGLNHEFQFFLEVGPQNIRLSVEYRSKIYSTECYRNPSQTSDIFITAWQWRITEWLKDSVYLAETKPRYPYAEIQFTIDPASPFVMREVLYSMISILFTFQYDFLDIRDVNLVSLN